jgi:hypothetical protein
VTGSAGTGRTGSAGTGVTGSAGTGRTGSAGTGVTGSAGTGRIGTAAEETEDEEDAADCGTDFCVAVFIASSTTAYTPAQMEESTASLTVKEQGTDKEQSERERENERERERERERESTKSHKRITRSRRAILRKHQLGEWSA